MSTNAKNLITCPACKKEYEKGNARIFTCHHLMCEPCIQKIKKDNSIECKVCNVLCREDDIKPEAKIEEFALAFKEQEGYFNKLVHKLELEIKRQQGINSKLTDEIDHLHKAYEEKVRKLTHEFKEKQPHTKGKLEEGKYQAQEKKLEEETARRYNDTVSAMQTGQCKAPEGMFGIHFNKKKSVIYLYCTYEAEERSKTFAAKVLGTNIPVKIFPSPPPRMLSLCHFCRDSNCPSVTGVLDDTGNKEWIGPGSPILAIKTTIWDAIKLKSTVKTLMDVHQQHDTLIQTPGFIQHRFIEEWTLGCHMLCMGNCHIVMTTAHPLEELEEKVSLTFLTQTYTHETHHLHELGTFYQEKYCKNEALDVLFIKISETLNLNLIQTKLKHPCSSKYFDVSPRFGEDPDLGIRVTKRGATSGNTYGQVIASDELRMIFPPFGGTMSQILIDAFAVSSTETESRRIRYFAEGGDSGSVVFEAAHYSNTYPRAFGMVMCMSPIVNELDDDDELDPNATVCVKLTKCIKYMNEVFNMNTEFHHLSTCLDHNDMAEDAVAALSFGL